MNTKADANAAPRFFILGKLSDAGKRAQLGRVCFLRNGGGRFFILSDKRPARRRQIVCSVESGRAVPVPVWGVASGSTKANTKADEETATGTAGAAARPPASGTANAAPRFFIHAQHAAPSWGGPQDQRRPRLGWGRPRIAYKTPPQVETKNPECGGGRERDTRHQFFVLSRLTFLRIDERKTNEEGHGSKRKSRQKP